MDRNRARRHPKGRFKSGAKYLPMHGMNDSLTREIAATAAGMIVDDGLGYGAAKRRALKLLGFPNKTPLPGNEELEDAVREHIAIFCPETQAQELLALRQLALQWMGRLAQFRPHLSAAVWRGTATRSSDIQIELFCDDSKSAEWTLIELNREYRASTVSGLHGEPVEALSLNDFCWGLNAVVGVHLLVYDHDDLRGALRADASGRPQRGDLAATRRMLPIEEATHE